MSRGLKGGGCARALRLALVSVHGDPLAPIGSEGAGGQNVYVRELARALAARGHAVDIFTRSRAAAGNEVHRAPGGGLRVIRIPAGPAGEVGRDRLFAHLPAFEAAVSDFSRRDGRAYDVLHTNYWLSGWVGLRLASRWRLPHFHTHHSLGHSKLSARGQGALAPERIDIEKALVQRARVVATSPQEVAVLREGYGPLGRVSVVPCGLDARVFVPAPQREARRRLGLGEETPLLLYAGRFDPGKGIDILLEALAVLRLERPVRLILAGAFSPEGPDGAEHRRLLALAEALGVRHALSFLGRLAPEELATAYAAADLCVVPSRYESFGLVAIESQACGTPVVASRVGGLPFAVREGQGGVFFPVGDAAALASACARLLSDAELRARLGRAGCRRVRSAFSWEAVAERLERRYWTALQAVPMRG